MFSGSGQELGPTAGFKVINLAKGIQLLGSHEEFLLILMFAR